MTPDFSIVTGGPLFRLWRRANLADEGMKLQKERLLFAVLIAWLPLLLLLMIDGRAWTETITHSFFEDVDIQVKLLVALPLLILAESKVHHRLPKTVETFLANGLLTDASRPRFAAVIGQAPPGLHRGRGDAACVCLRSRYRHHLVSPRDTRCDKLVCCARFQRAQPILSGLVGPRRQPAVVPVRPDALVLSSVHLGAVSLASVPHGSSSATRPS
jgi:hypothetical protein